MPKAGFPLMITSRHSGRVSWCLSQGIAQPPHLATLTRTDQTPVPRESRKRGQAPPCTRCPPDCLPYPQLPQGSRRIIVVAEAVLRKDRALTVPLKGGLRVPAESVLGGGPGPEQSWLSLVPPISFSTNYYNDTDPNVSPHLRNVKYINRRPSPRHERDSPPRSCTSCAPC